MVKLEDSFEMILFHSSFKETTHLQHVFSGKQTKDYHHLLYLHSLLTNNTNRTRMIQEVCYLHQGQ